MALLDQAAHRLLEHLRLRVRRTATSTDQGEQRSNVRTAGLEFAGHREYVPGDDARRIDWTAFARTRALTLRTFDADRDARIYIMVDVSASMGLGTPPKLDVARRIAASCGAIALRQSDRVQVIPFADTLDRATPVARGRDAYPDLEAFLCSMNSRGATSFAEAARTFAQRFPARGLVIVVSDLMECADWTDSLRALARHGHQLCVIHTRSADDQTPTLAGEIELTDAETGAMLRVTVTRALLQAYAAEVAAHVDRTRRACRGLGAQFGDAPIEMPFDRLLRTVLAPMLEAA